jgi:hypothetical protein
MQSEFTTERKIDEDRFYKVGEMQVIQERSSFDRKPHKTSNESSSGYVIDYELMLNETHAPRSKGFKKGEYSNTEIGEVILEQDQETSRESPEFSAKDKARKHLKPTFSNATAEGKKSSLEDPKDCSLKEGIQIFSMNFSDEKSLSSIDNRHKRISSVPRSLLSKKSNERSKDLSATTGTDLLTEPAVKNLANLSSPPMEMLNASKDEN